MARTVLSLRSNWRQVAKQGRSNSQILPPSFSLSLLTELGQSFVVRDNNNNNNYQETNVEAGTIEKGQWYCFETGGRRGGWIRWTRGACLAFHGYSERVQAWRSISKSRRHTITRTPPGMIDTRTWGMHRHTVSTLPHAPSRNRCTLRDACAWLVRGLFEKEIKFFQNFVGR